MAGLVSAIHALGLANQAVDDGDISAVARIFDAPDLI